MKIAKAYATAVKNVGNNIIDNMNHFGGVQGQIESRADADICPDNVVGKFIVLGEDNYRAEESHLAAALVRIRCVYNARKIWHVREDNSRRLVLSS